MIELITAYTAHSKGDDSTATIFSAAALLKSKDGRGSSCNTMLPSDSFSS